MSAKQDMQDLHSKQARMLNRMLDNATKAMDLLERLNQQELPDNPEERASAIAFRESVAGVVSRMASAPVLSAVNQFLKQNNVTGQNDDTDDLTEAEAILRAKRKRFSVTNVSTVPEDVQ